MALVGGAQVGISTDEPIHQSRMSTWFETGWYVPERFFDDQGQPEPGIEPGRWHAYGAGYSSFGHVVAVLAGAEQWGAPDRSAAAYSARGVAVALLGIAAAAVVGLATAVVAGSRLAGWWAGAAVLALPLWTGYSMFAVKDVPAATGWTLVTAGLVLALHWPPDRWRQVAIGLLCAAGIWFSVGVRTALWVPIAGTVAVFLVLAVARRRLVRGNTLAAGSGLVGGAVAVAAMHYRNAATPVEWLLSAVRTSGDFRWNGTTLTAGQLLPEKPPWWYLPVWLGGSMPLLLAALAVLGMLAAAALAVAGRGPGGPVRRRLGSDGATMALWGVQVLLLPVAATVGGATMYAGLRHHLYLLPALAALAGFAAARLMRAWGARWYVPAVLAIALVAPMVEQLQLFPYQFVYKNAVAGPVNNRWETDMHTVSGREALTRVPAGEPVWCYLRAEEPRNFGLCARHRQFRPFAGEQGRAAGGGTGPDWVWVIGRKYRGSLPPETCLPDGTVTRRLRGEDIILSYVLRCPPEVVARS
jgi:hypothetical protein